ncbi:putative 2-dehydropantoate 2-reductase [Chroococcidiopsis sp. FACHB-1243]|uniref:putative 2-dehydropantoate 2-reductase n=1 Tax=Chroococcidiopsis sp. [FACHB-1243] TaxID=2692781 RepID=UPI00178639A5|nr:putative 2-dehydropantoate 2-reductase [Chroococcidiopsis sp. [FACHB-1243]]MBD2306839.1 putative 2-dehydropantoate 2-reductase [Chroococcidiopsis sp. [FACHB-1243]]
MESYPDRHNRHSKRSYAMLGTGALGGYYGGCLQKAGLDVHFLLRSDYNHVSQSGLIIESTDGDFTLSQINAYQDVKDMPCCDVVAIALKTTQNHLLPDLLLPVLKEDGVVLVLQNGLGIEGAVAEIVGSHRVIGGMCFVCANKVAPGHIRHLDYKAISLGEYTADYFPAGITTRMQQIATDFESAGIPIDLSEDLLLARWQKLVWNIPYNGLSVILNARTDELMADVSTRILVEELMAEVVAGAARFDRHISSSFVQNMLDRTAKMKPYKTSMKIDYDLQRPLEVEAIVGSPLRLAEAAGTNLPQIRTLYRQLKFLDRKNQG